MKDNTPGGLYIPQGYVSNCKQYNHKVWASILQACSCLLSISPTPDEVDLCQGFDAILKLPYSTPRINIRIRDHKYYLNPETRVQFTLRLFRKMNIPTEYQKILRGYTDILFYGFYTSTCDDLEGWFIVDLRKARRFLPSIAPIKTVCNPDRSSIFGVYSLFQFPSSVLLGASEGVKECLGSYYNKHMSSVSGLKLPKTEE